MEQVENKEQSPNSQMTVATAADQPDFAHMHGKSFSFLGFEPRGLHDHMKGRGRDWFYFLHGAADLCLLISGHLTENAGRLATGALGVGRNASWFLLKKLALRSRADIMASFAAAASNVPQLVTSATLPETVAVSFVVTAYAMRGGTRLGRSLIEAHSSFDTPPPDSSSNSGLARHYDTIKQQFKNAFNESSGSILMKLPPFLLMGRAMLQTTDGVMRKDYSAIAAGLTFLGAAIGLMIFDNRNVVRTSVVTVSTPGMEGPKNG